MLEQKNQAAKSNWGKKYGVRHRWERIAEFPAGIRAPTRVRVYRRAQHYLLNWWDPSVKRNLATRVDGDLVAAIARAREIEERIEHFRSSGGSRRNLKHAELVRVYTEDLQRRADASEIDPGTVERYGSALGHYLVFASQPAITAKYRLATNVNREFAMEFAAWLANLRVSPNGHPNTKPRPLRGTRYVEDVVRSMFEWARDADRGRLLPPEFRNPFAGKRRRSDRTAPDMFGEPDITVDMAARFLERCDAYQLSIFSLLIFYGLRASEPCFALAEDLADGWLRVGCHPDLRYLTKGRRDKRLPLIDPISSLVSSTGASPRRGLLFYRRAVAENRERPRLLGSSREQLREEFERRCQRERVETAAERRRIRNRVFHEAGGLDYDRVQHEFNTIAKQLDWPPEATLKDFRHLFSTSMQNAGMPEYYRKYLMGHSPGKAAITTYTHLNELHQRYAEAAHRVFRPLIDVLDTRGGGLPAAA